MVMDDRLKKMIAVIFLPIFVMFLARGAHATPESFSWYTVNNKTHTLPRLEPSFEFIKELDAYRADEDAEKRGDKVIYLTFDAGYENGNVERIVNVLDANSVKGAFFILENLARTKPLLVKKMAESGHLVCNHTATHKNMSLIRDVREFAGELERLEVCVRECAGVEVERIYRPPEGRFSRENLEMAKSLGYKTVFWSFAYADWDNNSQMSPERALEKILSHTHSGEIMLLHPTSATNAEIMDKLIKELKKEGYRFGELGELWQKDAR